MYDKHDHTPMPPAITCSVCIEPMTSKRRVKCPYCDHEACRRCVQTYLLGVQDNADCMNCHHVISRQQLLDMMTKSFVMGPFKRHREALLFDRESAMMPSTQVYVNQELQRRANVALLDQLTRVRADMKRKLAALERDCNDLAQQLTPRLEEEKNRAQFVHKCASAGCNGYLSTAWKCEICKMYTCSDCGVSTGERREATMHLCEEEAKATMQVIKRDCKRCPGGCGVYISKVSGCDQMWCTVCHTAFSWRTGQRINGNIHNPHFYEFQRRVGRVGREAGDIPCGGRPSNFELAGALARIHGTPEFDTIMAFQRIIHHVVAVEQPRYTTNHGERSNLDLRVRYMLSELSREEFELRLQQREKAVEKKREIGMVLDMVVNTVGDMLRQIVINHESRREFLQNIVPLIEYVNSELFAISKRYTCAIPFFDVDTVTILNRSAAQIRGAMEGAAPWSELFVL